jgi:hypothetical protein
MNKDKYNLIFANHPDSRGVEDWILTLMGMLRAAGKDVSLATRFAPDAVNIVLECFDDEFTIEMECAAKRGCKIIAIATEYITGGTFNDFSERGLFDRIALGVGKHKFGRSVLKRVFRNQWKRHCNQTNDFNYFSRRFVNFLKAAKMAQAVWVAEPREVSAYAQLLGSGDRIVAFPYCWFESPHGATVGHVNGHGTHDIFFSGYLTEYRMRVIRELDASGFSMIKFPPTTPLFFRNQFADGARIILDLKKTEDWSYTSNLRLHYHLQRGHFIVSEKRKYASCLQPYIFEAEDPLSSSIAQLMARKTDLAKIGRENLERFRDERPASRLVPELLEQTCL